MAILLKLNANYADEFDCEEFAIVFDVSLEQVRKAIERACAFEEIIDEADNSTYKPTETDVEMYFGTNEFLFGSEVLSCTTAVEISDAEADMLMALLSMPKRGSRAMYTFGTGVLGHIEDHLYAAD